MPDTDTYQHLIEMLDAADADYRLIDHAPEGVTELVSALRGNPVSQAAKCIVLVIKLDRRTRKHVLAVVPGDRRVDLGAVRDLFDARCVGFADAQTADRGARSVPGTVLPFTFDEDVELIADAAVLSQPELFFNAARLDRSVAIRAADWVRLATPRIEAIAAE